MNLYKERETETLEPALFQDPPSRYRAMPFWAWNDRLEEEELLRQIEELSEMGFGGFHMHVRSGMATEYLGREFMSHVKACVHKAKDLGMLACLYDEDRYASGAAGGFVTQNPLYSEKFIRFTVKEDMDVADRRAYSAYIGGGQAEAWSAPVPDSAGYREGKPYLLAVYDVVLDEDGMLKSYRMMEPDENAAGTKWYAYVRIPEKSGWFNGHTYVDTLSEEAVASFINITHEAYRREVGEAFGDTVPSIFTDEPNFHAIGALAFSKSKDDVEMAWTTDLPATFRQAYGYDIVPRLPEIIWDLPDCPSKARYHYHDHVCSRYVHAFIRQIGSWCEKNGIHLTGHVLDENRLGSQTRTVGEAMRAYEYFGIPGIDMLCNYVELTTAKQAQSSARQWGKEGVLSELYGVTGWEFDFRGHKFQGDWQAALGVTMRVPHLSWYSMKGSAKRDYPASIHYQSAWYKEYRYVEDHFARLNTVLTRGRSLVRVGVIHPIESYWLSYGPADQTADLRSQIENNFQNVTNWLLRGTIDFDFLSEASLPGLYKGIEGNSVLIGQMRYQAIVLPGLLTLRSTTADILEQFLAAGGKVILLGDAPCWIDGCPDGRGKRLAEQAVRAAFTSVSLLAALEDERDVSIRYQNGERTHHLMYQMRTDGAAEWLFLARMDPVPQRMQVGRPDAYHDDILITVKGRKIPVLYDTVNGTIRNCEYELEGDRTCIRHRLYCSDSLLLKLIPPELASEEEKFSLPYEDTTVRNVFLHGSGKYYYYGREPDQIVDVKGTVSYSADEDNVLVLDIARWSLDGQNYQPPEEILRIDQALRRQRQYPLADGEDIQPWLIQETGEAESVFLEYRFESSVSVPCRLASEGVHEIILNGEEVPVTEKGYFTDRHIKCFLLPCLKQGMNTLVLRVPFGKRISLENAFLLGQFGVAVSGAMARITERPEQVTFGSLVHQGFPFYGAGFTYEIPFSCEDSEIVIAASMYQGALVRVWLDDEAVGRIVYAPYKLRLRDVKAGKHLLKLKVYLSRANCFGALHCCTNGYWIGPICWYTKDTGWAYEYQLKDTGILKSPVIEIYRKS